MIFVIVVFIITFFIAKTTKKSCALCGNLSINNYDFTYSDIFLIKISFVYLLF